MVKVSLSLVNGAFGAIGANGDNEWRQWMLHCIWFYYGSTQPRMFKGKESFSQFFLRTSSAALLNRLNACQRLWCHFCMLLCFF